MLTYFAAFEVFFEDNLPKLFAHFKKNNLTPDIYLIDWWVSSSYNIISVCVFIFLSLSLLFSLQMGMWKLKFEGFQKYKVIKLHQILLID